MAHCITLCITPKMNKQKRSSQPTWLLGSAHTTAAQTDWGALLCYTTGQPGGTEADRSTALAPIPQNCTSVHADAVSRKPSAG